MKVSTGQQQDKSRRGRQQRQTVGASSATLSFDAIFDGFRAIVSDFPEAEQSALFHDNALRVYRMTRSDRSNLTSDLKPIR